MATKGAGVNVFMLMGKLRTLEKRLDMMQHAMENTNTKLDDIRNTLDEIKAPVVKALERSE